MYSLGRIAKIGLALSLAANMGCGSGGGGGGGGAPSTDVMFMVSENAGGRATLHMYEMATAATTTIFDDAAMEVEYSGEAPYTYYMAVVANKLYFSVDENTGQSKMWVYDPTQPVISGTNPVRAFEKYVGVNEQPEDLLSFDGKLYYSGFDGANDNTYVYDPSQTVSASNPALLFAGYTQNKLVMGGKLYMNGWDSTYGNELWVYDPAQAVSVSNPTKIDINAGNGNSGPSDIVALDGKLYFRAYTAANGYEARVYDPNVAVSASNPSVLYDIVSGAGHSYAAGYKAAGGKLYFGANDGVNGTAMYVYDPAVATSGTNPLRIEINAGVANADPVQFTMINGKVAFRATGATNGSELYLYDPNVAVSASNPLELDIEAGATSSYPYEITAYGADLYFAAVISSDLKLMKYDATQAFAVGTNPSVLAGGLPELNDILRTSIQK